MSTPIEFIDPEPLPQQPLQLLDSEGVLRGEAPMIPEQITTALRLMLLSRAMDELCTKLQRLGRIGLYTPVHGQEAAVLGSAMALDPARDWMVPASREQPAMLHHGWALEKMFAAYMGRLDEAAIPSETKLLPRQQSIGAQLPHAAGLAWALKIRRAAGTVMVYCGDGATSEGDFHEGCNLAGVMRVPLIVVVINNQYAISTPVSKQTAAESLAVRAAGYGFPGLVVDGNDVFAVYAASRQAVDRALHGDGPSLIECRTYRVGFHNTSDNPREYRNDLEVDAAVRRDPLRRLRKYALAAGLVSEADLALVSEQAADLLQRVQRQVASIPKPGPEAIFEHVYAELPPRTRRQMEETLREAR